jgi:hypothetical protein
MTKSKELTLVLNRCIQSCEECIDECENFSVICAGTNLEECAKAHGASREKIKNCMVAARTCSEVCTAQLEDAPSDLAATLNECIESCNKCVKACENALRGCTKSPEACRATMKKCIKACNECAELCEAVREGSEQ